MKTSSPNVLFRFSILLLINVVLLSLAGRLGADHSAGSLCVGWPLCVPISPLGWFRAMHALLAASAAILQTTILLLAWRTRRGDAVLLPLTTVSFVLFFGQAFLGAVMVVRDFRSDLVILHAANAISFWVSLLVTAFIAWRAPRPGKGSFDSTNSRNWRDFLALSKPWIVALLLFTTLGGLVAGGRALPAFGLAAWTLLGGALAAGGSSALNQYIDRNLDRNMQRTARRPLPAGRLTAAEALSFGLSLCLAGYYVLAGLVNFTAALLALAGIMYYVIFYSILLKRATVQNIVVGGGAGAIPPMVGWAAATGHLSPAAWILFLIIFMWTPPHFWALAIVRKKDYENAGVPMLPVVRGERSTRNQILVYTVLLVASTLALPLVGAAGAVYAIAAALLGAGILVAAWQVWTRPGNKVAWAMYRWSSIYLVLIFLALIADSLV
jgi:protoheme IX farnesyltransferase